MILALPALGRDECDADRLRTLSTHAYEHRIWGSIAEFRHLEPECAGSANLSSYSIYRNYRGQLESFIGNHEVALQYVRHPTWSAAAPAEIDAAVPAVDHIVSAARDRRIIIVNERHHASDDRLLTLDLLKPLAGQGFKYLALEALWSKDPINTRKYPIGQTGYYTNDVIFAELIREALSLGYELVAYEMEPHQTPTEWNRDARELWQAKNIASRVFAKDPDARVLVHCGYAHAMEAQRAAWHPMAVHLREMTNFDPLTIDQTTLMDLGSRSHPLQRAALNASLAGSEAVVLLDDGGGRLGSGLPYDISVVGRITTYVNGRPQWMSMGGRRVPVRVPTSECEDVACIVEVGNLGRPDEVAFDRVEVRHRGTSVVYVPTEGVDLEAVIYRIDGEMLARRGL